jgi:hypothetical protein
MTKLKLSLETIKDVTGTKISEDDGKTITKIFVPATEQEIINYCNRDFKPEPTEETPEPVSEYPMDLGIAACKRVLALFNSRSQTDAREVKSEQVGSLKKEFFEGNASGKSDEWYSVLDKYRVPNL